MIRYVGQGVSPDFCLRLSFLGLKKTQNILCRAILDFKKSWRGKSFMTIELLTSLIFLVSSVYGPAPVEADTKAEAKALAVEQKKEIVHTAPISLEKYVKEYFKDDPILAEVAKCESTYRHYKKDGTVIRGLVNSDDIGVMQINEKYHADRAEKLGFDIYNLEDNLAYAKWLYEKEGLKPWKSSSKCWVNSLDELAMVDGVNGK